jgi:hypothetical protein
MAVKATRNINNEQGKQMCFNFRWPYECLPQVISEMFRTFLFYTDLQQN